MLIGDVYTCTGVLRDANGDGFPDVAAASVVLGDHASPLEAVAAIHIAARLGLECLGLELPIVRCDSDVAGVSAEHALIVIGTHNATYEQLASRGRLDLDHLKPGDGSIRILQRAVGGRDVILVAGLDDEGTLAAADHLATAILPGSDLNAAIAYRRGANAGGEEAPPADGGRSMAVVVSAGTPPAGRVPLSRERIDHLSLARLYGLDGYLRDHDGDLIPDGTNLTIVLPAAGPARVWAAAGDFAARVGMESGGLTFPLAILDIDVEPTRTIGGLGGAVIVGSRNRLIGRLGTRGLAPAGTGARLVSGASGDGCALLVAGLDPDADVAVLEYLARRAPFLAGLERGQPTLGEVEDAVAGLLSARSAPGQAAAAIAALGPLAATARVAARPLQSVSATAFVDEPDAGLAACLESVLAGVFGAQAEVTARAVDLKGPAPVTCREETYRWEVDELWAQFEAEVEPRLGPESDPITIDVRLSEPRSIRERIKGEMGARLRARGVARENIAVQVLSAYKQGYSWLEEVVLPAVRALGVLSVRIRFRRFDLPGGAGWLDVPVAWMEADKPAGERRLFGMAGATAELRAAGVIPFLGSQTRWLQELYPIDEVLADGLGIHRDDVRFEMADIPSTYEVECTDGAGKVVFRGSLSVPYVERDYIARYPDWGKVHVTTGLLAARCGSRVLANRRIVTDLEQIWDSYQRFLPVIEEHVLAATERSPTPDKQPFVREVRFEVWASEPNELMDIRHEIFSTLEALHEDLYYVTLDFFKALGAERVGEPLSAPGQILPLVHAAPGAAARSTFSIDDFAGPRPMVSLRTSFSDGGTDLELEHDLVGLVRGAPLTGIELSDDHGLLTVELTLPDVEAEAVEGLRSLAGAIRTLEAAGLYADDLGWPGVRAARLLLGNGSGSLALCGGQRETHAASGGASPAGARSVPLDRVLGYEETESLLRTLADHLGATVWEAGRTFQGRRVQALDLMFPTGTRLWSQAKASIFKPTYHVNCRHHANEASATTAALWLAELLLTDPGYLPFLRHVNVCVVPFENADGATLHYELQREHPTWMHHAARYNAAGLEFATEYFKPGSKFPEATARPRSWQTWLPDLVVDCHERPGHEWRQPFSGWAPPALPYLWILPSLFTGIIHYTDSPDFPDHLAVALALRQAVVDEINADEEIRSWNLDWQDRYRKYAHDWAPGTAPASYHEDVQFHFLPLVPDAAATDPMQRAPQVTAVSFITEVADETPQGEFMALCARATLIANRAALTLLADAAYTVLRTATESDRDPEVRIALSRPRPIRPSY